MVGKPKMFFIQACWGDSYDKGVRTSGDDSGVGVDSNTKIPKETDFLFGFATPSGYVAHRRTTHGSWYISELCTSLSSYARFADLESMLKVTNDKVGREWQTSISKYKEAPEFTSRLRKSVFFFPRDTDI